MAKAADFLTTTLDLLRSHSLTSVVQKEIERMIVSGELKARERINENLLAAKLSISRGPIREACRGLEQAGLVTVIVNRGVFVREVSLKEALEAYDIRACLFGLAGKALAGAMTQEQVIALQTLIDRMETVKERNDVNAYYPLNLEFHNRIVEFSGNVQLAAIYHGLVKLLHLFRRRGLVTNMNASNAEHRAILDALVTGDPERARQLMERHVLAGKARLLAAMDADGAHPTRRGSSDEDQGHPGQRP